MEKFPNFENKPESPNRPEEIANTQGKEIDALTEKKGYGRFAELRKKLNVAILYGSISLTALIATGCGNKKAEQAEVHEGTSRFPKAEQVEKSELESKKSIYPKAEDIKEKDVEKNALLYRALSDISNDHFSIEPDGSLIIEVNGAKWQVAKKEVVLFQNMANSKLSTISSPKSSPLVKDVNYQTFKQHLKNLIDANGKLLNTNEYRITDEGQGTRHIQRIEGSDTGTETNTKTNRIRTSTDLDKEGNF